MTKFTSITNQLIAFNIALFLGLSALSIMELSASQRMNSEIAKMESLVKERAKLQSNIRSLLGYGGAIHNFKNYVLRKQQHYFESAEREFSEVISIVADFEKSELANDEDRKHLAEVKKVAEAYLANLYVAQRLINQKKLIAEVDRIVKIDDTFAIAGLDKFTTVTNGISANTKEEIATYIKGQALRFSLIAAILLLSLSTVSIFISRRIIRSVRTLKQFAADIREGNLDNKVATQYQGEFSELAADMDFMRMGLKSQFKRLQHLNAELAEFSYVASHDLQEPLRKITAFGEKLEKNLNNEVIEKDKALRNAQKMMDAAQRMRKLISSILTYSKLDHSDLEWSEINLEELVREVVGDLEVSIRSKGAEIHYENLHTVYGIRPQMRQLFQNLISNSIKFCLDGEQPKIRISTKETERGIEVRVSDNGIGFEHGYLEKILKPFQRLHGKSEFPGTGMGLAICQKIIKRHGYDIDIDRKISQGTTFVFGLPREKNQVL